MTPNLLSAVTEWRVMNLQRTADAASSNSRFFIVCISFKTSSPQTECRIDYDTLDDSHFMSIGFSIRISNLDPSQYHVPCPPHGQAV
eukprot:scaffold214857_cov51-Cyclotella_meneghiniana.AAC.3